MDHVIRNRRPHDNHLSNWCGADPSEDAASWIGLPGYIFLRILQAIVVPLIACAMILGVQQLMLIKEGYIAGRAAFYYAITTIIAATEGLLVFSAFRSTFEAESADTDVPQETLEI